RHVHDLPGDLGRDGGLTPRRHVAARVEHGAGRGPLAGSARHRRAHGGRGWPREPEPAAGEGQEGERGEADDPPARADRARGTAVDAQLPEEARPIVRALRFGHTASVPHHSQTSRASRRASPSRLKPMTAMKITTPGMVETHHCPGRNARPRAIIAPQSGVGSWAPTPRKESPLPRRITKETSRVALTTIGETTLGRICWKAMPSSR